MLILKKVAITGGLSTGKSSVCKILKEKGAYVVSADDIVHQLLIPQTAIGKQIIELLGPEIVDGDQFDRKKIAQAVFEDKKNLKILEQILHPAVLTEIEDRFNQIKDQKKFTLFVAEIPLLYEIEKQHQFDLAIVVAADAQIAKKRYESKTGNPLEEFEKRMTHQLSLEEKAAKADYVILNNGSMIELEKQVNNLYTNLTQ
ncbi:MAG: dephospho-CoA kinase [Verrucomicrobia bacterium]|nr:dephospho-CoA kinase [Verrucomicrobiota bacterium]